MFALRCERYTHDAWLRRASATTTVGGRALPPLHYAYDAATGRVAGVTPFTFERPHAHRRVTRDHSVEIVRELDSRGRQTDVWYRFNNHVVFTVETKYDALGQVRVDVQTIWCF